MLNRLLAACVVLTALSGVSHGAIIEYDYTQTAPTYTLTQVNDAGGIRVGDKLFTDFIADVAKSQGALAPGLDEINIRGVQVDGDFGLVFTGLWQATGGQLSDTTITFKVTAGDGYLIKDNGLKLIGFGALNGGSVGITENVYDGPPLTSSAIANKIVSYTREGDETVLGVGVLEDHEEFTPLQEIWVVKDVGASGGVNSNGFAHVSQFMQTFSQIPEPATMALLAFGGLALLRRRRQA